jgi:hypothetical protein
MQKAMELSDLSANGTKLAQGANVANIVSAGANIAGSVFGVISNISDTKQRALFEANYRALSDEQQKKIDQQVASASSQTERLKILANSLTQLSIARISNQAGLLSQDEKKKRNQMLLVGGIMIATGLIITYIIIKKL